MSSDFGSRPFQRDLQLVRAVLRGERGPRRAFAERMACVPRILKARNARAGNPLGRDELLDLVQDVQLAIWDRLGSYEGRASLDTWAFRFCSLAFLRALERRGRRPAPQRLAADDLAERRRADAGTQDLEQSETLESLLRHLSPREAEVARLKFLDGLEFEEIASVLSISTSSVKTLCYRGLAKLREALTSTPRGRP